MRHSLAVWALGALSLLLSAPAVARPDGDYADLEFEVPAKPAFYRIVTLDKASVTHFGFQGLSAGQHTDDPDWFAFNPHDNSRPQVHWAQFYSYPARTITWMRTNCTWNDGMKKITCQFTLSLDGGQHELQTVPTVHMCDEGGHGMLISILPTKNGESPHFHISAAP